MELIRGLHNIRPRHQGCVATIGAFDGVHRGHQAVLAQVKAKARELHLPALVITLEPLPREYFAPRVAPARLMSFREKLVALSAQNVDRVLGVHFDKTIANVSAESFIEDIFYRQLGMKYMVVGDDLRFGHERRGDFSLLTKMGEELGFGVSATQTLKFEGERASSTRIRHRLEAGDFATAEALLGRPYTMGGKVVYGQQLGRTINVPTANLLLHRIKSPMAGVYAIEARLRGDTRVLKGVANVGTRPTVDDSLTAILEVHLLDFNEVIYGQHLEVTFLKKLRDEKKFESFDALKVAIYNDIEHAKQLFSQ
jgi:riboflavin kinase/FMN adenylyltransferase